MMTIIELSLKMQGTMRASQMILAEQVGDYMQVVEIHRSGCRA